MTRVDPQTERILLAQKVLLIHVKNGKRKGNLPKNEEIYGGKAHTNTWKLFSYFLYRSVTSNLGNLS